MNLYLNKAQAKKAILDHIQEELTTEEFCSLLIKLIKLYKQFEGAETDELRELL